MGVTGWFGFFYPVKTALKQAGESVRQMDIIRKYYLSDIRAIGEGLGGRREKKRKNPNSSWLAERTSYRSVAGCPAEGLE